MGQKSPLAFLVLLFGAMPVGVLNLAASTWPALSNKNYIFILQSPGVKSSFISRPVIKVVFTMPPGYRMHSAQARMLKRRKTHIYQQMLCIWINDRNPIITAIMHSIVIQQPSGCGHQTIQSLFEVGGHHCPFWSGGTTIHPFKWCPTAKGLKPSSSL